MSDINQQRESVYKVSKSPGWRAKVSKMPDSQITAIYIRLRSEGKL